MMLADGLSRRHSSHSSHDGSPNHFHNGGSSFQEHDHGHSNGKDNDDKKTNHARSVKHDVHNLKAFLCTPRGICLVICGIALVFLLPRIGNAIVAVFRWAEERVDSRSWLHMLYFLLLSLLFHFPAPIPVVMQAWAIAIGCFFKWRGFILLAISFSIGVPMSFLIGRYAAQAGDNAVEKQLQAIIPTGMAYVRSLGRAVARTPAKLSFLLMWAPLPTSMCPFMVGFIVPARELPLKDFLTGAVPSKLMHFSCSVLIGIQAGSFASAMDSHDGGGAESAGVDWGRVLAVGCMVFSVVMMCAMMVYIHGELGEVHAWQEGEEREDQRTFVKVL